MPDGFLKMDETTEAGALRELKKEMEFDVERGFLEQLGCFPDIDRDPRGRVITIAYYALVQKGTVARKAEGDIHRGYCFTPYS